MPEELRLARSSHFTPKDAGYEEFRAAQCAERGARALTDQGHAPEAPLLLAHSAVVLAARAAIALDPDPSPPPRHEPQLWERFAATELARAALGGLAESRRVHLRKAIEDGELGLLALAPEDRVTRLRALEEAARALVSALEHCADSPRRVQLTRFLRIGTVSLAALLVAGLVAVLVQRASRTNLALGATVTASSQENPTRYPAAGLTDGNRREIGVYTKKERDPWVSIDLGSAKHFTLVEITNRDRSQGKAVPLVVEVSQDGKTWTEFDKRQDTFSTWTAEGDATARYVRLRHPGKSQLHLNEVAVY